MKRESMHTNKLFKSPSADGRFRGVYNAPRIEIIRLDNQISLEMESEPLDPPGGPYETKLSPAFINDDPYKTQLG